MKESTEKRGQKDEGAADSQSNGQEKMSNITCDKWTFLQDLNTHRALFQYVVIKAVKHFIYQLERRAQTKADGESFKQRQTINKYGKLRRVQDQGKVAVGGKTGSGDGPVYKYGKWREVHAGESYVNRGKAVDFTGEKFDHGNDTLCELGKMKKIDPRNHLHCYGTSGRSIWTAYMYTLLFSTCLIPAITPLSLSNNSTVACSGQQIRYECLANSPELFWSSPEYIGPTGVMIEFSGSIDNVGAERRAGNAAATLLGLNGRNVTSSELVITASQDFPTASVTCDDGVKSVTSVLKVPGAPGTARNIRAWIQQPPCSIVLQWDLPINVTASFISHFVVEFEPGLPLMIPPLSPVAAWSPENCNLNGTVRIRAVDICGRQGVWAEVLLRDVLQDMGSVTENPSQTTAASQPDATTGDNSARDNMIVLPVTIVLVLFSIVVITVITVITVIAGITRCYRKRPREVECVASDEVEDYATGGEKQQDS